MLCEYWASAATAVATLNRYYNDLGTMDSSRHKNTYMCIYTEKRQTLAALWQCELMRDGEEERKITVCEREEARWQSGVCGESWGWEMLWEAKSPPEHNAAPLIQAADMGHLPSGRQRSRAACRREMSSGTSAPPAQRWKLLLYSLVLLLRLFCNHCCW